MWKVRMRQIQIKKSEKELMFERMIDFVKKNSYITKKYFKDNDKTRILKCPCDDYYTIQVLENKPFWDYRDSDEIKEQLWRNYHLHLVARIRLRGDIDHMRLFVKIFGKDFARIKLKEYARKSMIVHNNLKLVLREMGK